MKHLEPHTQTSQGREQSPEELRPLRLDRQALRLDPPVVRFSELNISVSDAR